MDPVVPPAAPVLPDLDLSPAAPDPAQWRSLVHRVLDRSGTADAEALDRLFARRLVTTTSDGIALQPLYTNADALPERTAPGAAPFVRGASAAGRVVGGWDVRAFHADPDPVIARDAVLADLEGGATSLHLVVGDGGLAIDALPDVLEPVLLDLAGVVLDAGHDGVEAAHALRAVWQSRGLADDAVSGCLGLDPIGAAARSGGAPDLLPSIALATANAERHPRVRSLVVDATVLHDAGATDAQELGGAIACGLEYVRALVDAGLPVDLAVRQLEFRFAATADQFATMAKLRAARLLWSRVVDVIGGTDADDAMRQHAVTSWPMLTRYDPWVNLLRGTVAGFAAGTAGADAVTVLPFDSALGIPDAFGRRLARNTQALLLEESHAARVIDPAGGSFYVEQRTDAVARAAWTWFQALEAEGGYVAALASGRIATDVAEAEAERAQRVATRRLPITGVSEFPAIDEELPQRRPAPARAQGGLPRVRIAAPFEALRDRAAAGSGPAPEVVLVSLGPLSASTARTTFAKNLYEAGGIRTRVVPFGEVTADDVSGRIVCLCSSDAVYATDGADAARTIASMSVASLHLAGTGADAADELRAAGIATFVHVGIDVLDLLRRTLDDLGVPA